MKIGTTYASQVGAINAAVEHYIGMYALQADEAEIVSVEDGDGGYYAVIGRSGFSDPATKNGYFVEQFDIGYEVRLDIHA